MLHVIMEYLPQHLPLSKITQLWQVNIPYMEHMGYIMEKKTSHVPNHQSVIINHY